MEVILQRKTKNGRLEAKKKSKKKLKCGYQWCGQIYQLESWAKNIFWTPVGANNVFPPNAGAYGVANNVVAYDVANNAGSFSGANNSVAEGFDNNPCAYDVANTVVVYGAADDSSAHGVASDAFT